MAQYIIPKGCIYFSSGARQFHRTVSSLPPEDRLRVLRAVTALLDGVPFVDATHEAQWLDVDDPLDIDVQSLLVNSSKALLSFESMLFFPESDPSD